MLKLHVFGPGFGLADPSPFVVKGHMLLKLAGLAYEPVRADVRKAPKSKLPVLEDNGELIADTTFIRLHIEKKYGVDYDARLTLSQRGTAWAIEKMLEDHFYFAMVHERWLEPDNFARGPAKFFNAAPAPLRPLIRRLAVRDVRRRGIGHGMGRHSKAERTLLASRAIDAVANVLGDRSFLMGDTPCGADATVYAFMSTALGEHFDSAIRPAAQAHSNIVAYCARIGSLYFAPS